MSSFLYDLGRERFLGVASGSVNWTNDTIKAVLVSSSYTPAQATDDFVANKIHAFTGTLTAQTLAGKATNGNGTASASNVTFSAVPANFIWSAVVLFKHDGTANPGGYPLIAYMDSTSITGLPLTSSGGDITISWNTGANKIFKL